MVSLRLSVRKEAVRVLRGCASYPHPRQVRELAPGPSEAPKVAWAAQETGLTALAALAVDGDYLAVAGGQYDPAILRRPGGKKEYPLRGEGCCS